MWAQPQCPPGDLLPTADPPPFTSPGTRATEETWVLPELVNWAPVREAGRPFPLATGSGNICKDRERERESSESGWPANSTHSSGFLPGTCKDSSGTVGPSSARACLTLPRPTGSEARSPQGYYEVSTQKPTAQGKKRQRNSQLLGPTQPGKGTPDTGTPELRVRLGGALGRHHPGPGFSGPSSAPTSLSSGYNISVLSDTKFSFYPCLEK